MTGQRTTIDGEEEAFGLHRIAGDLAEQRTADRRLAEREAWFAEAQAVAKVGSWTWDIPADSVTWSPEFYEMLGLEPGSVEATYQGFIDLIHPGDRAAAEGALRRAIAGGDTYAVAHRLVRVDGGERMMICRGRVYRDSDGAPKRMVGASLDLTDYMGVAEEFRHTHEQLLAAEELAGVGSFEYDPEADEVIWSEGMYRLLRMQPHEFDGTLEAYLRLVHPDDRDRRRAEVRGVIEDRATLESVMRLRRGDGTFVRVQSRIGAEPAAGGGWQLRGVCWEMPGG